MDEPFGPIFPVQAEGSEDSAPSMGTKMVELRDAKNLAELTAHWKTLQCFMLQWGSRQEQLLMCGDTFALLDASQIHLVEADPDDREKNISSSKGAAPMQIDHGGEKSNNPNLKGGEKTWLSESSWYNSVNSHSPVARPPDVAVYKFPEREVSGAISVEVSDACPSPSSFSDLRSPGANSTSDPRLHQIQQLKHFRSSKSTVKDAPSLLKSMMTRTTFDMLCGAVIFANAIITGVGSDIAIKDPFGDPPQFLARCETFFVVFYTLEIVLRIHDQHCDYFTGPDKKWNIFDLVLVIQGLSEQIQIAVGSDAAANFSFLRLLRLMKMLKLLRMIRLLRMFRELRLILSSIFACVTSMLWTGVLIMAITYLFGIIFVQACTAYLQQDPDNIDPKIRTGIERYWNSASTAILSLYMSSLGGQDWEVIAEPLGPIGLNGGYYFFFLVYIAVFTFVVMNVISSIFLESILTHADKDQQLTIEMQMEQKEEYIKRLQALYQLLDDDKSGEISYAEFCSQIHSPPMQAFAASLQIDIADARQFFLDISDRGTRAVDMDTFVVGCIKLKGTAKSVDLCELKYSMKKFYGAQRKASHELHEMASNQKTTVHDLHELATEQHQRVLERKAFDQKMLQELRTLMTCVKQMFASGAAPGSPAAAQDPKVPAGFHLQL